VHDGLAAHGSTVLLLDDATGFPVAVVAATHLTALRTAAVDAVAVDALARPDASRLVVVGTGHQAGFDARAIAYIRPLTDIAICGRNQQAAARLVADLASQGLPARVADVSAVADADIVVTVTSAHEPLLRAGDLRLGTHISAMGADSPGKQELDVDIPMMARCVVDRVEQASSIGELQHALAARAIAVEDLVTLSDVLIGAAPGRRDDREVTMFDSSGMAIQDLAVCSLALARAEAE